MRIGIDAAILAEETRHSGIGRYVSELVERLPRLAPLDEFVLFTPGGEHQGSREPNVTWAPLPRASLGKLSMLAAYQWHLPGVAERLGIDVFHAPTVHPRPTWPSIPWRMPCPVVVTVHDLIPLTFYDSGSARLPWRQRAFYRWNLRAAGRAARVVTVSDASRRELMECAGFRPERIVTVHNGVEAQMTSVHARQPARRYILFVGSFEARKNLITVVRAFRRVASDLPGHDLVVVAAGRSGNRSAVDEEIRASGLTARIRFEEQVVDDRLRELYQGADVLASPSLAEGFGLAPLEAMAYGTPVIASALPAHMEVLGDAAGYVAPADDIALGEAIIRIAREPGMRARMSELGRRQAERYPVDAFVRETLAVYRAVAMPMRESDGVKRERISKPSGGR